MILALNDIKKLSIPDRVELTEVIWQSIDEEIILSDDQKMEIDRRIEFIDKNETDFFTWEETIAHIRTSK